MQLVLTDEQAQLVALAIPLALENSTEEQIGDAEDDLKRLAVFFTAVADEPSRFPVTGSMAAKIKRTVRAAKGPAQVKSRRGRKGFGVTRTQGQQKRDRAAKRAEAENYNQAREHVERDMQEAEEVQAENVTRMETLLGQPAVRHGELVELFTLLGVPALAAKAEELAVERRKPEPEENVLPAATVEEFLHETVPAEFTNRVYESGEEFLASLEDPALD